MRSLDLCIPAHDEEAVILQTLRTLSETLDRSSIDYSIIVAENGSTDRTADVVEAAHIPHVRLLRSASAGKGGAIKAAATVSISDFFGFIDADLSADPKVIPKMIASLEQGNDVVVASRLVATGDVHRSWSRSFSSRIFNQMRHLFFSIPVADSQCGLKIMNARGREILCQCQETGWFLDVEFLVRAQKASLKIEEIAVPWEEFRYPDRKAKLRVWRDGWRAIRAFVRIRKRLQPD